MRTVEQMRERLRKKRELAHRKRIGARSPGRNGRGQEFDAASPTEMTELKAASAPPKTPVATDSAELLKRELLALERQTAILARIIKDSFYGSPAFEHLLASYDLGVRDRRRLKKAIEASDTST